MKNIIEKLKAQYIVDKCGNKTAVVLDIDIFNQLLEEIEDIYLGCKAESALQNEQQFMSHEEVIKSLGLKKS